MDTLKLSRSEREQIAEILDRRANEISGFYQEHRASPKSYGSVELALEREMERLRILALKVQPEEPEEPEED
jgi:hypothetical protein